MQGVYPLTQAILFREMEVKQISLNQSGIHVVVPLKIIHITR